MLLKNLQTTLTAGNCLGFPKIPGTLINYSTLREKSFKNETTSMKMNGRSRAVGTWKNSAKRKFTCTNRLRYSQAKALQKLAIVY